MWNDNNQSYAYSADKEGEKIILIIINWFSIMKIFDLQMKMNFPPYIRSTIADKPRLFLSSSLNVLAKKDSGDHLKWGRDLLYTLYSARDH